MSQTKVVLGFIGDNAVTPTQIVANAVTSTQIAANAVTTGKIAANAVTTGKIAANAVTTDRIADNAVTPGKLSTGKPTWDTAGKLNINGASVVPQNSYIKLGDCYISSGTITSGVYADARLAHFGTNAYYPGGPDGSNWVFDGRGPGGMYQIIATAGGAVGHNWYKHDGGQVFTNLMSLSDTGILQTAQGYRCRAGSSGGVGGNIFNIFWTGSGAQLYIDNSYVGNISLSSDYRIKKNVQTQTLSAIERVSKLRPITYELQNYGELFKEDGVQREGFIAHELAEVIPSAVEGEKDAPNQIQSLRLDALVSVLTKAIQEAVVRIETLEAEVAELKNLK
jgi:hypothetical protein